MVRMPSSNMSVNVRRWIILFVAVGTRVSRLTAFVSKQVPHPSKARVAFRANVAAHRSWVGPLRQLCIWKQAKTLVSKNNHYQLQSFLKLNNIVTQPSEKKNYLNVAWYLKSNYFTISRHCNFAWDNSDIDIAHYAPMSLVSCLII